MLPTDAPWSDLDPSRVVVLLEHLEVEWWVCGGWAIDLWLGTRLRDHADFDVGCARRDVRHFVGELPGWAAHTARSGVLEPWSASADPAEGSLWLHRAESERWDLQLMPEDVRDGRWYFRRDPGISASLDDVLWRTKTGTRVLRPEVQLLYKARDVRPKDQVDFTAVVPTLDAGARSWLRDRLSSVDPDHRWLADRHLSPGGRSRHVATTDSSTMID